MSKPVWFAVTFTTTSFLLAQAQEKKEPIKWRQVGQLWMKKAEIGDVGPFEQKGEYPDSPDPFFPSVRLYRIKQVISPSLALLEEEYFQFTEGKKCDFLLQGIDTSKMVTDRKIDLPGMFKVVGVKKSKAGEQLLVVEPESKEEKEKREAHEKRIADAAAKEKARVKEIADAKTKEEAEAKAKKAAEAKRANDLKDSKLLLDLAKEFAAANKPDKAAERLRKIVKDYPDTPAAKEAAELLKKLEK